LPSLNDQTITLELENEDLLILQGEVTQDIVSDKGGNIRENKISIGYTNMKIPNFPKLVYKHLKVSLAAESFNSDFTDVPKGIFKTLIRVIKFPVKFIPDMDRGLVFFLSVEAFLM